MKITEAVFVRSATAPSHYPDLKVPEFAFYGRSNTGKSSLINALVHRKDLVKTGSKPGMTRSVNFFLVNKAFSIADLPGFGYAELPQVIRQSFKPMMDAYFENRAALRVLFLLLDIRRTPDELELEIIDQLTSLGKPTALIATKADKVSKTDALKGQKRIAEALGIDPQDVFVTSAKTGRGIDELRGLISDQIH